MTQSTVTLLIPVISGLSILLVLIRPRNLPEVYWVGAGAALLVALRLVPFRLAGNAIAEGSDVYFFLTGMMLLSALASEEKLEVSAMDFLKVGAIAMPAALAASMAGALAIHSLFPSL